MVSISFYGSFQNFLEFSGIFWNFLIIGENNIKTLASDFSPLLLLHATIKLLKLLRQISDYSVYYQNAFAQSKRKSYL